MADIAATDVHYEMTDLMRSLWYDVETATATDPSATVDVSLGAYGGYRALIAVFPSGTDIMTHTLVYASLGETEDAPMRMALADGVAPFAIVMDVYDYYGSGFTREDMVAAWRTVFVAAIGSVIEEWFRASVSSPVFSSVAMGGLGVWVDHATLIATADVEIQAFQTELLSRPIIGTTEIGTGLVGPSSAPRSPVVSSGDGNAKALARIETALQDIALRTTVTSINDKTAIVELGTNDVLIPG